MTFAHRRASLVTGAVLVAALAGRAAPAAAQKLDLAVSPATITFSAADPDVMPIVISAPVTIEVRIRQSKDPWQLTMLADGDLISGPATVDISNVTWTATPAPPFQNGTVSKTVAQRLASGIGPENPALNGSVTFRLTNSWTYPAGFFSQTLVFTLSSP